MSREEDIKKCNQKSMPEKEKILYSVLQQGASICKFDPPQTPF